MSDIKVVEEVLARMAIEMEKSRIEAEKRRKEFDERLERSHKEAEEWHNKFQKELEESRNERMVWAAEMREEYRLLREMYGGLCNSMGGTVELVVVPGIRPKLSELGHDYDNVVPNKTIKDDKGQIAAEIDLLLDNCKEAMAVEIKTRFGTAMVDQHLLRLKKMRMYENSAGIRDKTLYGAMAGVVIYPDAEKYALKKGLYVIEILEDDNRLEVKTPEGAKYQTQTW